MAANPRLLRSFVSPDMLSAGGGVAVWIGFRTGSGPVPVGAIGGATRKSVAGRATRAGGGLRGGPEAN
jgi:hypothetical protein